MTGDEIIFRIVVVDAGSAALDAFQGAISSLVGTVRSLLSSLGDLGVSAFNALADGAEQVISEAVGLEDAMNGVKRTANLTNEQMATLTQQVRTLATVELEGFASSEQLAQALEIAGQMGIITGRNFEETSRNGLIFAETMVKAAVALDGLDLQSASERIGLFHSTFRGAIPDVERAVSVLNHFGNTTQRGADYILNLSGRMAESAHFVGLSEQATLALAATLGNLNQQANTTGTAMGRIMRKMRDDSRGFAEAFGMDADRFSLLVRTNMEGALQMFAQRLSQLGSSQQGVDTVLAGMRELQLTGQGVSTTLLGLGNLSDTLSSHLRQSYEQWRLNTSASDEFASSTDRLSARWGALQEIVQNIGGVFGSAVVPAITSVVSIVQEAAASFYQWFVDSSFVREELPQAIEMLRTSFAGLAETIVTTLQNADWTTTLAQARDLFWNIIEAIRGVIDIILTPSLWETFQTIIPQAIAVTLQAINWIVEGILVLIENARTFAANIDWQEVLATSITILEQIKTFLIEFVTRAIEIARNIDWAETLQHTREVLSGIADFFRDTILPAVTDVAEAIVKWHENLTTEDIERYANSAEYLVAGIIAIGQTLDYLVGATQLAGTWWGNTFTDMDFAIRDFGIAVRNFFTDIYSTITNFFTGVNNAIREAGEYSAWLGLQLNILVSIITGPISSAFNFWLGLITGISNALVGNSLVPDVEALNAVLGVAASVLQTLISPFSAVESAITNLSDEFASMENMISQGMNSLSNTVSGAIESMIGKFDNFLSKIEDVTDWMNNKLTNAFQKITDKIYGVEEGFEGHSLTPAVERYSEALEESNEAMTRTSQQMSMTSTSIRSLESNFHQMSSTAIESSQNILAALREIQLNQQATSLNIVQAMAERGNREALQQASGLSQADFWALEAQARMQNLFPGLIPPDRQPSSTRQGEGQGNEMARRAFEGIQKEQTAIPRTTERSVPRQEQPIVNNFVFEGTNIVDENSLESFASRITPILQEQQRRVIRG